jgi:hypothetical protein
MTPGIMIMIFGAIMAKKLFLKNVPIVYATGRNMEADKTRPPAGKYPG